MSEELNYKQTQYLADLWEAKRKMADILADLQITPDELAEWGRSKLFRRRLRNVEWSLNHVRESEIRRAAAEAARVIACIIYNLTGIKTVAHLRACKFIIELARRIDPWLRRGWKRPLRREDVVDPVHPAYRDQAERLMDEMEDLRTTARRMRRERNDQRFAESHYCSRPWGQGGRGDEKQTRPGRPSVEEQTERVENEQDGGHRVDDPNE